MLAILVLFELLWPSVASAQSIIPEENSIVNQSNNTYDITGGVESGTNLFHSFQDFGLNSGETANFISHPEINNILGRVTGGNASIINGLIQVTGGNSNLFLINPAGIVFGANASLNVPADFIATTASGIGFNSGWFNVLGVNEYEQLIGTPSMFRFEGNGAIANFGNLNVTSGHQLGLLGSSVLNSGTLTAPGGNIFITAVPGESLVNLSQPGHLLSLQVDATSLETITPSNLPDLLMGGEVNHADRAVVLDNGNIQLVGSGVQAPTDAGVALISGEINVSNNATAGNVAILGDQVALVDANINANGNSGGGNVFLGGDFQGLGTLPNASQTFVSPNTFISANALERGDGGRVILWADGITRFHGNISATGGNFGGNGGFVEVSGKQHLIFRGNVDTTAPQGTGGTLLLDPENITIVDGFGWAFDDNGEVTIYEFFLENLSGTSNLVLEADNNITLENLSDNELTLPTESGYSVTFTADADENGTGDIVMNDRSDTIRTQGGDISMVAASINIGNLDTTADDGGGNISLTTETGNIITGDIESDSADAGTGGNITLLVESGDGKIDTSAGSVRAVSMLADGGNISLTTETGDIITSTVASHSENIGKAGNITLLVESGDGKIDTSAGILLAAADSDGGNVSLTTETGDIITSSITSESDSGDGGDITLLVESGSGNINIIGNIDTLDGWLDSSSVFGDGGDISLRTQDGNIITHSLSSISSGFGNGGDITLLVESGDGKIDTSAAFIVTAYSNNRDGGDISLTTQNGDIITSRVESYSNYEGKGGNITLTIAGANGSINTNTGFEPGLNASSDAGDGGNIFLTTENGDIVTNTVESYSDGEGRGGDISLLVNGGNGNIDISAGNLDAYSDAGDGGNVSLTTETGDIVVGSIDARGGTDSIGGNIEITTGQLFRATDTFTLDDGQAASIATNGGATIYIRHGGGTEIPFIVGDATTNGTAGLISDGTEIIEDKTVHPPYIYEQGNIAIETDGAADNQAADDSAADVAADDAADVATDDAADVATDVAMDGATDGATDDVAADDVAADDVAADDVAADDVSSKRFSVADTDEAADNAADDVAADDVSSKRFSVADVGETEDEAADDEAADDVSSKRFSVADVDRATDDRPATDDLADSTTDGRGSAPMTALTDAAASDTTDVVADDRPGQPVGAASSIPFFGIPEVDLESEPTSENIPNIPAERTWPTEEELLAQFFANLAIEPHPELLSDENIAANPQFQENLSTFLGVPIPEHPQAPQLPEALRELESNPAVLSPEINVRNMVNALTVAQLQTARSNPLDATVKIPDANITLTADLSRLAGLEFDRAQIDRFIDNPDNLLAQLSLQPLTTQRILREITPDENTFTTVWNVLSNLDAEIPLELELGGKTREIQFEMLEDGAQFDRFALVDEETNTIEQEFALLLGDRNNIGLVDATDSTDATETTDVTETYDSQPELADSTGIEADGLSQLTFGLSQLTFLFVHPNNNTQTLAFGLDNVDSSPIASEPTIEIQIDPAELTETEPIISATKPVIPEIVLSAEPIATNIFPTSDTDTSAIATSEKVEPATVTNAPLEMSQTAIEPPQLTITPEITSTVNSATQAPQAPAIATVLNNALATNDLEAAVSAVEEIRTEEYEEYFGENLNDKMATAQSIRETLQEVEAQTGTKPAIIYVMAYPDRLELLLFPSDGAIVRQTVEVKRDDLLQEVNNFQLKVTSPLERRTKRYEKSAQQLYEWIVAPLSDALAEMQIDTLVFCFDQGLRGLPVAALYDGQEYLIEQYSLSIMPSISLTDTRYSPVQNLPVLAMGASTFTNLNPLPAVPTELATITNSWQGEMLLNEEFTLGNLQQQRIESGYRMVHLATHAEFDPNDIDRSYVQLWDRQIGFAELRDLDLEAPQVELLVFSACRTAVGNELAELGFAGLAVKTGAKSAIASLWYVDDVATLGLMSEFYQQLNHATIKAEAIRQAQIALLREEVTIENGRLITSNGNIPLPPDINSSSNVKFWHPYYWSGFTTIGSPW